MLSRRKVLKYLSTMTSLLYLQSFSGCDDESENLYNDEGITSNIYSGKDKDTVRATKIMLEKLGGIESIIDKDDIVVLKPNSQWWLQGMTNTDVIAEFIRQVLAVPNFSGEIIIVDNHQCKDPNSRGWVTEKRNGKFNLNELVEYFNDRGFNNVTKYHWHPAGKNPTPLQMSGSGNNVISHPSEGDGYIWPLDLFYESPNGNKCILAYPVFTSSYSGTTIDLKNGAFKDNKYTGQPVKFINFSAINHHSKYTGLTASIKNYMGVVDMSCGFPAPEPSGFYNTHHVGATSLFKFLAFRADKIGNFPFYKDILIHSSVFRFRYTGGVLGKFMKEIKKADLNIITAINVGWGSRTNEKKSYKADTVIASTDPVSLDFWAAKNILLKATIEVSAPDEYVKLNDPELNSNPFRHFLIECQKEIGGTLSPESITLI